MNAGRLDEAFELLIATPQREHRDGQRVTDALVQRLVSRGDRHLSQDRLDDAKSDAEKARLLAGRIDEVSDLVRRVRVLHERKNMASTAEREAAAAARIQTELGQFTLGQNLLPSGYDHSRLNAEIQRKRSLAADAAMRIEQAVNSNDLTGGVAILNSLEEAIRRHRLVAEQSQSLVRPMLDQVMTELRGGRLDRAAHLLNLLSPVACDHSDFSELKSVMERCFDAINCVSGARYADADRELAIAEQIIGRCQWISLSRESLAELQRHSSLLSTGPLGLLDQVAPLTAQPTINKVAPKSLDLKVRGGGDELSQSDRLAYLLRVDGLGAILLLGSDTVSIGCFSKSKRYDIPIQTQGHVAPVLIRRTGEDYFAESEAEFRVNEQPTHRRLLTGGDSISFGRRGRLRFRKPVPASGSAVLQLTGAGLVKQEIRHVALMSDSLVFSNGGGHFSVPTCDNPIVVFSQSGGYAIKYAGAGGDVRRLELGRSELLGQTRFTLNQIHLS